MIEKELMFLHYNKENIKIQNIMNKCYNLKDDIIFDGK